MTSITKKFSFFQRMSQTLWLRRAMKTKRTLTIDRLEWSTDYKITHAVFGLIIAAFSVMAAWIFIITPDQLAFWIASFLADISRTTGASFPMLLKSFGVALIVLIDFTIIVFVVMMDQPETVDILQALVESDDRTEDAIAGMENNLGEKLAVIERNTVGPEEDHDNPK